MRLGSLTASAALSAVLLSGCSFITGEPDAYRNPYAQQKAAQGQYGHGQYGHAGVDRCQVFTPQAPVPQGCRPEQVTLGVAPQGGFQGGAYGGFPQQPQFGQPNYATGGYGQGIGHNPALAHNVQRGPRKRKPKLRGSLSLGAEKSIGGDLVDYDKFSIDAASLYNSQVYREGRNVGSDATGDRVDTTFTANTREVSSANVFLPAPADGPGGYDQLNLASISYNDAWLTPAGVKGGLEYIVGDRTTVFANAGYFVSEGTDDTGASVEATVYRVVDTGVYDTTPADPVAGTPETITRVDTVRQRSFVPNQEIARFNYDFSDMRRIDLEAGARHYFNPLVKGDGFRTLTPFIGASAGASHFDDVDVKVTQQQRFYERAFDNAGLPITEGTEQQFYDITGEQTVTVFEDQWVPTGQVNVGAEWQLTPGFALAAETGMRVTGGRKYANGARADTDVSIPLTLRGSLNF